MNYNNCVSAEYQVKKGRKSIHRRIERVEKLDRGGDFGLRLQGLNDISTLNNSTHRRIDGIERIHKCG